MAGEGGLGRCGTIRKSNAVLYSTHLMLEQLLTTVEEYLLGLLVSPLARCLVGTDSSSAVLQLGQSLFPLFALTLNLPEDFFDDKVSYWNLIAPRRCSQADKSDSTCRCYHAITVLPRSDIRRGPGAGTGYRSESTFLTSQSGADNQSHTGS